MFRKDYLMFKRLINNSFIRNLVLYGIFGVIAAVVDFSVFTVCFKYLLIDKFIANLISMHIGMLVSFTLNTFANFKKPDKLFRRFLSYYIIVLVGMGITTLIIWLGTAYLPVLVLKAISIVVASIIQFFLNRFITYKF
jgi:putative flippase GtrA